MTDQFAGWAKLLELAQVHKTKAALREAISASGVQILETEPLSGYYRCAAVKGGRPLPVAIWRDEKGALQIWRDGEPVALERVWPYCVWTPIPYDWYEAATERGEKWPDEHVDAAPDVGAIYAAQVGAHPAADREVSRTDNQPPEESEIDALKRQIEAAKENAESLYATIGDDETAAAAQSLRSRLNEMSGTADKKREAEKKPHFDAAKAVDAKWQPLVKLAKAGADAIRDALKAWETKKFKAQQEAQRKRDEEAQRAAAQLAADRAAAEAAGKPMPEPVAEVEQPVEPPPVVAGTIKGASGRAARVVTIKVARVVDYDKAFQHLKAIPEIKMAIDKVAQRMIDAGNTVPGVEVNEERDVA